MQAYRQLEALFEKLAHLEHFTAMAHWDEAVMMPVGGGDARAAALAALSAMEQNLLVTPKTAELLEQAKIETLESDWQRANLRLMERAYKQSSCIPEDLLIRLTETSVKCQQAWRVKRAENNWADFLPLFAENIELNKIKAELMSEAFGLSPYDALLDHYSPGVSQAMIDPIFTELKNFLPSFLKEVMEVQKSVQLVEPQGPFSIPTQESLALEVMKTLGFDFNHGRLDVSHHPFCGGVSEDVRITTRYSEDSLMHSLMAVNHETGHALYEQHRPKEWRYQPVGHALGMSVHESQSLLVEMQACRSLEFLSYLTPLLKKHFGDQAAFNANNLYQLSIKVKPGYIRIDADELSYPLHVILRYELEKQLISGKLLPKDLPEAWDQAMQAALGLSTAGNYRDGVMQDVHWPAGIFGYFPAYTLGRLIGAQLFHSAHKAEPLMMQRIAAGDFVPLVGWLNQHIHSKGSLLNMNELLMEATGEGLNPDYFIQHVKRRYKNK